MLTSEYVYPIMFPKVERKETKAMYKTAHWYKIVGSSKKHLFVFSTSCRILLTSFEPREVLLIETAL